MKRKTRKRNQTWHKTWHPNDNKSIGQTREKRVKAIELQNDGPSLSPPPHLSVFQPLGPLTTTTTTIIDNQLLAREN